MRAGRATGFFRKGIFCVRLNQEPSGRKTQAVAIGVDPGSKKEGFSVISKAHTFLNIQADAITDVKDALKTRREMRRSRRFRKTPCRANRKNRKRSPFPPSTKARWQWKLRILRVLASIYPITTIVVEDIAARTQKGKRRWNASFSPLEVGKTWFYEQAGKIADLVTRRGWETHEMRTKWFGLPKTATKMSETFEAHAVDAWCLAAEQVGALKPTTLDLLCLSATRLHRRNLHRKQPGKGGIRSPYGGTRSLGFKRGALVKHAKRGLCYVGGTKDGRISLHDISTGKRLCQNAKPTDIRHRAYGHWPSRLIQGIHPKQLALFTAPTSKRLSNDDIDIPFDIPVT